MIIMMSIAGPYHGPIVRIPIVIRKGMAPVLILHAGGPAMSEEKSVTSRIERARFIHMFILYVTPFLPLRR